jgi:hypothetical protein
MKQWPHEWQIAWRERVQVLGGSGLPVAWAEPAAWALVRAEAEGRLREVRQDSEQEWQARQMSWVGMLMMSCWPVERAWEAFVADQGRRLSPADEEWFVTHKDSLDWLPPSLRPDQSPESRAEAILRQSIPDLERLPRSREFEPNEAGQTPSWALGNR